MKVALIGGAGYIGQNLAPYLGKSGITCEVIDKRFGYDMKDYDPINTDVVVDLACLPGIVNCSRNPEQALQDNIFSTFDLFEKCERRKVPIIFFSSQAAKKPYSSFYALTKHMAEKRLQSKNISSFILRLTNVYGGPNYLTTKNTIIAKMVLAKRNRETVVIDGHGTQTRDFVHVDDVCKAILNCISKIEVTKWKFYCNYDVGTGKETSIEKLASIIGCARIFNSDAKKTGPMRNVANLNDNIFNPDKYITLEQGLKKCNYI